MDLIFVALNFEYSDLEIYRFLKVTRSFENKLHGVSNQRWKRITSIKEQEHAKLSNIIKTPEFIQQVQQIIDNNPSKFIR